MIAVAASILAVSFSGSPGKPTIRSNSYEQYAIHAGVAVPHAEVENRVAPFKERLDREMGVVIGY